MSLGSSLIIEGYRNNPCLVVDFDKSSALEVGSGVGGVVYRDGDTAVKIFRSAEFYGGLRTPDELMRKRLEEISYISKFGEAGIAPEFLGLVRDIETGDLGFRMEYINGVHLVDLPPEIRDTYRSQVLNMAEMLTKMGYWTKGDLEIMIAHDDGGNYAQIDRNMLYMVDVTSIYPLDVDPKIRNAQVAESRNNLLLHIDGDRRDKSTRDRKKNRSISSISKTLLHQ